MVAAVAAQGHPGGGDGLDGGHAVAFDAGDLDEAADGVAAAELTAEPTTVAPGEPVELTVVNHGEVDLGYGRPITVERWDGEAWVETDESREAMWTMELLMLPAGQTGEAQTWPFAEDRTPEEGWYRFTKSVRAEAADGDTELTVRARVRVDG
jgi:hypothetical protein